MNFNEIISCRTARAGMTALLIVALSGCAHEKNELAHDHAHEHAHEAHNHGHDDADDHDGEAHNPSEIVLEPEIAQRMGVQVEALQPGNFAEAIHVTGRILDTPGSASVISAPTSGIVKFANGIQAGSNVSTGTTVATISSTGISGGDRNASDKAALTAAERELNRLKPLYDEGIVSQKEYNAALEAYEVAKTQYSPNAANGSARSVTAGAIGQLLVSNGQYVEAGTPIATVNANQRLTLRADVPDRYSQSIPLINNARIIAPNSPTTIDLSAHGGKRVTASNATTREQPGYIPLYFAFDNNGLTLPQTIVDVYLIGASRPGVLSVPKTAISEQQGLNFVYRQLDDECYEKVPVTIGGTDGERIEIIGGVQPGDVIVVNGTIAVRLAETSSVVPEGHTHNH